MAHAQYSYDSQAEKCKELGIKPEDCSPMEIAKRTPFCPGGCGPPARSPEAIILPIVMGSGLALVAFVVIVFRSKIKIFNG